MLNTPPGEMYILSDAEINDYGFYGQRTQEAKVKNIKPSLSDIENEALLIVKLMLEKIRAKIRGT